MQRMMSLNWAKSMFTSIGGSLDGDWCSKRSFFPFSVFSAFQPCLTRTKIDSAVYAKTLFPLTRSDNGLTSPLASFSSR